MSTIRDDAEKVVDAYFTAQMPEEILRLTNQANFDLYNGPITDDPEWPGFVSATDMVSEWVSANLCEVWVDTSCDAVYTREPEGDWEPCYECGGTGTVDHDDDEDGDGDECPICRGSGERWVEPNWEDYYHFKLRDVKCIVFGSELAAHI